MHVRFGAGAIFVDDAVGQAGVRHVLATRQERPDAVVKNVRVAAFVHAGQQAADFVDAFCEAVQAFRNGAAIVDARSGNSIDHEGDGRGATHFNHGANEVKPRLVQRASKCSESRDIL